MQRNGWTPRRWAAAAGATLLTALMGGAAAQPGNATQPEGNKPPPNSASATSPEDPAEMRERLLRRIADLDARSEMLRLAVQRIDAGATAEDVRIFIRDRSLLVAKLLPDTEAPKELERVGGRRWREGAPEEGMRHAHPGEGHGAGPGPMGMGRERMVLRKLTEEDRELVREIMEATRPEAWTTLERLREKDPEDAEKRLVALLPHAMPMMELRRRDPEMYRLRLEQMRHEVNALKVAAKIAELELAGAADAAQLAKLKGELRVAGGRVLDLRIAVQAQELARLQERLNQLRGEIAEQDGKREQLIDAQIARLVDDAKQRRREGRLGPLDDAPPPPPHAGGPEGPGGRTEGGPPRGQRRGQGGPPPPPPPDQGRGRR